MIIESKEEKYLLVNNDRGVEKGGKNKNSYAEKKRIRIRLTWINKRSNEIDKAIEGLNKEINAPENTSDHSLLKEKLEDLELLEGEYLELLEEKEIKTISLKTRKRY